MVKSAAEASAAYKAGIERIGIDAWQRAAGTHTPKAAATILQDAKQKRISISDMVSAYERAYE